MTPWLLLQPVIEFILEREVCIVQTELQKFNDVLYWQYRPVMQGIILFQEIFNNVKGWIYRYRGEQCRDIIWVESLPWKESNLLNPLYKIPSTLYVVRQLAYKGLYYPSEDFSHPISNWAPAGYNWPEGVSINPMFCYEHTFNYSVESQQNEKSTQLIVLSSHYPFGWYTNDPVIFSAELLELWFFPLSLQSHWIPQSHLWMTTKVETLFGL